jgi:hypothetical protein
MMMMNSRTRKAIVATVSVLILLGLIGSLIAGASF